LLSRNEKLQVRLPEPSRTHESAKFFDTADFGMTDAVARDSQRLIRLALPSDAWAKVAERDDAARLGGD